MIAVVVVVVVVNCEGPTLLDLTLSPAVGIIIVCVDNAKCFIIIVGVKGLDAAVTVIIQG